jgi:hypothetical protein
MIAFSDGPVPEPGRAAPARTKAADLNRHADSAAAMAACCHNASSARACSCV